MDELARPIRVPVQPARPLAGVLIVLSIVAGASGYSRQADETHEGDNGKRDRAKAEAVVLWTGLAIVSILIVGLGLIWGVTRAANRILKKREPTHTEMPNIWYLNPPEKRKQDEP
jgi:hypothetical protein